MAPGGWVVLAVERVGQAERVAQDEAGSASPVTWARAAEAAASVRSCSAAASPATRVR